MKKRKTEKLKIKKSKISNLKASTVKGGYSAINCYTYEGYPAVCVNHV